METNVKRVLFVSSEMVPYLADSEISSYCRSLAQGVQESRVEIRTFMPRYGLINERKNQLHEVIRLSGMNLIITEVDRPLIIKVASLPSARMQIYFIDNEDYFRRKALATDAEGKCFKDNGERAVFFARGVLETVKKLRWSPDIIHCSGWIAQVLPLFLKKCYKDDPIFSNSKVVTTLFANEPEGSLGETFKEAVLFQNVTPEDVKCVMDEPSGMNLAKLAMQYSDGVVIKGDGVSEELKAFAEGSSLPVYVHKDDMADGQWEEYKKFYNSL